MTPQLNNSQDSTRPLTPLPRSSSGVTGLHPSGVLRYRRDNNFMYREILKQIGRGETLALVSGCAIRKAQWNEAEAWDQHRLLCIAAGMKYPNRFLTHESAIEMHRLPRFRIPKRIVVGSPKNRTHRTLTTAVNSVPVLGRQIVVPAEEIVLVDGIATTSLAWTVATVLAGQDEKSGIYYGLMVLEEALKRGLTKKEVLRCSFTKGGKIRGRMIRKCLDAASKHADSPAESFFKGLAIDADLPIMEQQVDIYDADSRWLARVDFFLAAFGIIIEIDGEVKYYGKYGDGYDVLRRERRRDNDVANLGYRVIRLTWEQLLSGEAVEIVAAALRAQPAGTLNIRGFAVPAILETSDDGTERHWIRAPLPRP